MNAGFSMLALEDELLPVPALSHPLNLLHDHPRLRELCEQHLLLV